MAKEFTPLLHEGYRRRDLDPGLFRVTEIHSYRCNVAAFVRGIIVSYQPWDLDSFRSLQLNACLTPAVTCATAVLHAASVLLHYEREKWFSFRQDT